MRILCIYDCVFPESIGGVEKRNWELARALARRGHGVTLAGFTARRPCREGGVELLPLGRPGRLYNLRGRRSTADALRFAVAVARLDLDRFDVIETANIPYAHLFPLAFRCRLRRRPLVITWYEYWGRYWRTYLGAKWPLYAAVEWSAAGLGEEVLAISALTAQRLAARRRAAVPIVASGIDCRAIREAAGAADPTAPPLVYAGRLVREKRVDLLLEAVALLAPSYPGPLLTIVGDGNDRGRLEAARRRLGLEDRVRFTGPLPAAADVWREIARARVAVQPSSREGFGIFPLEAMACGLPVVHCASPESAVGELVRDGVEGLCVEPEPAALAEALGRLLGDAEHRRRLAASALTRAGGYDWDAIAVRLEAVLAGAITDLRPQPGPPAGG
jgi:glycosyltransferase involved in cell wall biosynthesis